MMESLKTLYSLAKTKTEEKAATKQLIEKLLAGQARVLLLPLMINDNRLVNTIQQDNTNTPSRMKA